MPTFTFAFVSCSNASYMADKVRDRRAARSNIQAMLLHRASFETNAHQNHFGPEQQPALNIIVINKIFLFHKNEIFLFACLQKFLKTSVYRPTIVLIIFSA